MKVVVTGAAGFIGSHTCEQLVARGNEVIGVDSFNSYLYPAEVKRRNAADLRSSLPASQFQLVEANICDTAAMERLFDNDIDVLCHLAALAGVRPSLLTPQDYVRTNVEGTINLLERCHTTNVSRIVSASSSSVYGVRGNDERELVAFRESDPCLQPASPYAATKRAGELLCSTYRDLYGLGITSLRFFTVFGPRQRPDMAMHKFMKAVSEGQPITLFGDGTSRRDYTYIDDIVAGVCSAIEGVKPEQLMTINLGGTVTTSLVDLVSIIEEIVGKKAIIDWQPNQPGDVPITYADITVAREELGYEPTVTVREGLERFWRWYQEI